MDLELDCQESPSGRSLRHSPALHFIHSKLAEIHCKVSVYTTSHNDKESSVESCPKQPSVTVWALHKLHVRWRADRSSH